MGKQKDETILAWFCDPNILLSLQEKDVVESIKMW
jgi:hypothetical protein